MTVLEVIQKSAEFLAKRGVESPRLQAELLLAHVLKLPRMKLYLSFERPLTDAEADAARQFMVRRGQREPLQHIVGSTSFCGFEIAVSRAVLVPRPETELLAEAGWEFLNQRAGGEPGKIPGNGGAPREALGALDIGTGSGCLAIAIARRAGVRVVAVDISNPALELARSNVEQSGVAELVELVSSDGFAALRPGAAFDLILSNPPYIPSAEIETLDPEVRDFDPRGALDGGADGLDFYRRLAVEAAGFLKPEGKLMLEFGDGQAAALKSILEAQNWIVETVRADYSQRQRILTARR